MFKNNFGLNSQTNTILTPFFEFSLKFSSLFSKFLSLLRYLKALLLLEIINEH
jgi:hypothetical protein